MTWMTADFGPDCVALPVGVTQMGADGLAVVPRTTVGVTHFGNGFYGAELVLDPLAVVVQWDTGTGVFACESAVSTGLGTEVIEAGYSAAEILRLLAAHAAGSAANLEGASPSFTGLDGTTTRIAANYVSGTRTITSLDGN